ncbi:MAG: 16S rRNA (cytosine(1402)-N(4))-methyltransferase RsmH, partial [Pseudomonadota bacterium]
EGRLTLIEAPFDQLAAEFEARYYGAADVVVFDFGVSSMQLDQAERGFSFRFDGPLDMRMGAGRPVSDFVNEADEADIANVIYQYGEERRSRGLARAIISAREEAPITTTAELAAIAERVIGTRGPIHPATRMFQGLRIFVNDELGQIVRALIAAEQVLKDGGRLIAVSFHSLEDRIVKRFLAEVTGRAEATSRHAPMEVSAPSTFDLLGKAVPPTDAEIATNPRARSARLRAARRTDVSPRPWDDARLQGLGVPPMVFSPLQQNWA